MFSERRVLQWLRKRGGDYMNSPEVIAAMIAASITLLGLVLNGFYQRGQQKQWQESFGAELRRDLTQESALEVIRRRLTLYPDVWKALKITAGYEWDHLIDKKEAVQKLANTLTDVAYSETGFIMTDRSRRLLLQLRSDCGSFIQGILTYHDLKARAYQLKHSMRSDVYIIDQVYESALNEVAQGLGKVDDWTNKGGK
jgi:hypothetical protein